MNTVLLTKLKDKYAHAINKDVARINNTSYVFLKFFIMVFVVFGLVLTIYFLCVVIFSHHLNVDVRAAFGICMLITLSSSVILGFIYAILFSYSND